MRNVEWIKMLNDWADEADSGEDVSLDGATLRELANLLEEDQQWWFSIHSNANKSDYKYIDVRFRNGLIERNREAHYWDWSITGDSEDILHWRPAQND